MMEESNSCIIFSSEYPQIDSAMISSENPQTVQGQSYVFNRPDYNSSGSYPVYNLLANPSTRAASAHTMPIMTYGVVQPKSLDEILKDPFHQSPMWGSTPIQQMPRNQAVAARFYGSIICDSSESARTEHPQITYSSDSLVHTISGPNDMEINYHRRSNLRTQKQCVLGSIQNSLFEDQSVQNLVAELKLSQKVNILRYVCRRSVQNRQWDMIVGKFLQLGKMTTTFIRTSFKHDEPNPLTDNERIIAHGLLNKLNQSNTEEPSEPGLEDTYQLTDCEETFSHETENLVAVNEDGKVTGSSHYELLPNTNGGEMERIHDLTNDSCTIAGELVDCVGSGGDKTNFDRPCMQRVTLSVSEICNFKEEEIPKEISIENHMQYYCHQTGEVLGQQKNCDVMPGTDANGSVAGVTIKNCKLEIDRDFDPCNKAEEDSVDDTTETSSQFNNNAENHNNTDDLVARLEVRHKQTILRHVFQRNVINTRWDEELANLLQLDMKQVALVRNTIDYEEIIQLTREESLVAQNLTNVLHQLRKDTPVTIYREKNTEIALQYMLERDIYVPDDDYAEHNELVRDYGLNVRDVVSKMSHLRMAIANGKFKMPLPFTIAKLSLSEIQGCVFRRHVKSGIASQFEMKRWPLGNPRLIELRTKLLDLMHTKNSCVLLGFELNQLTSTNHKYRTTIRAYEYLLEDIVTGAEESVSSNLRQDLMDKLMSTSSPRSQLFDDIPPEGLGQEDERVKNHEKSRSRDNESIDQIHEGKDEGEPFQSNASAKQKVEIVAIAKCTSKRKHEPGDKEGGKKSK